tara:strand:+ start:34 stop:234 length:201 start_codon:yes stop_codon:yes gene_type:complete
MGMVKKECVEHEIRMEDLKAGLEWMTKFGVKTFQDHTGEWVEVRCAKQFDFFSPDPVPIPHSLERS